MMRIWREEAQMSVTAKLRLAECEELAAAKLARLRAKRSAERRGRKQTSRTTRQQASNMAAAASAGRASQAAWASTSSAGAAASDGAMSATVALVSREKERRRRETADCLLLDWADRARLEQEKFLLQAERDELKGDRQTLQATQAKFWETLLEECGHEPVHHEKGHAMMPSAPLLKMLGEMAALLPDTQIRGLTWQARFLQKVLRETDATLLDALHGWNRVAGRQIGRRGLDVRGRKGHTG